MKGRVLAVMATALLATAVSALEQAVDAPGDPVSVYRQVDLAGRLLPLAGGELYVGAPYAVHPHGGLLVWSIGRREIQRHWPDTGYTELWGVMPYQGYAVEHVATAPDGDIWVRSRDLLIRYDAYGTEKRRYFGTAAAPLPSAEFFSPDGTIHGVRSSSTVVRLEGDTFVPVFEGGDSMHITQAVFDREGRLYLSTSRCPRVGNCANPRPHRGVMMLDSAYSVAHDPFALAGRSVFGVTFLRDEVGAPTSRLVMSAADEFGRGFIYEANPAGVPAPGTETDGTLLIESTRVRTGYVGIPYADTLRATSSASWSVDPSWPLPAGLNLSPDGVLAGVPLEPGVHDVVFQARGTRSGNRTVTIRIADVTPADAALLLLAADDDAPAPTLAEFLDQRGNANGVYDVGDLRALVDAQ